MSGDTTARMHPPPRQAAQEDGGAKPSKSRLFLRVLRVAVTAVLFAIVLSRAPIGEIGQALRGALERWPMLLAAALLPFVGILLSAARWRHLLRVQGVDPGLIPLALSLAVAAFVNQIVPSTIGGDVARAFRTARTVGRERFAGRLPHLAVVFVDRGLGLTALILIACAAAALQPHVARGIGGFWEVIALLCGGALLVLGLLTPLGRRLLGRVAPAGLQRRFSTKAGLALEALGLYRRHPRTLFLGLLFSLALQFAVVSEFYLLSLAIDAGVSFGDLAVIVPLVTLITMLPVTVGGIGLRENAFVILGAGCGLAPAHGVALGWLFFAIAFAHALLGGLVLLVEGFQDRRLAPGERSGGG